jgi:hypothetical protein
MTDDVSVQDSDYDGAWKEALRKYLRDILECYFPAIAATIAWEQAPEWSDKELSQILGQAGHRNRAVDVLVKVQLRDGTLQWILLHLEIQRRLQCTPGAGIVPVDRLDDAPARGSGRTVQTGTRRT